MRRIERYLALEIVRPVAGTLAALIVVVLVFYASRILAEAATERFSMSTVVQLMFLRLGMFLDVLLPVALVLGIVLGLGRLQAGNEMTALAAVGAGRRRILIALSGPVLIASVAVGATSLEYRPWAYKTLYRIEAELASRVDLAQVSPGRFTPLSRDWLMFAERRRNDRLENVMVHRRQDNGIGLLRAGELRQETDEEARYRLVFSGEVQMFRFGEGDLRPLLGRFERLQVIFTPPPPPERERLRRALPMAELRGSGDGLYQAELQWRLLGPVSVLVLALAAVSLSRIDPRSGQSARVLTASLLVTFYFSSLGVLMNWLEEGRISPWPGIFWLPIAAMGALSLRYWLVHRGPGGPL